MLLKHSTLRTGLRTLPDCCVFVCKQKRRACKSTPRFSLDSRFERCAVMLNEVKHPRNRFLATLGMTKERYGAVQQNLHSFVTRISLLAYLSSIIFLVCTKVCDAPCAVRR
jgi:hypothetical protein